MTQYYQIEKTVRRNGEQIFTAYRMRPTWLGKLQRYATVAADGHIRYTAGAKIFGELTHPSEGAAIAACRANADRIFARDREARAAEIVETSVVQNLAIDEGASK